MRHPMPSNAIHPLSRPQTFIKQYIICKYIVSTRIHILTRECHGFVNPCGLTPRVHTGTGTGWGLVTLTQPAPALRARRVLYMNVTCLMGIRRCPANIGRQCKRQTFLLYSTCGVDPQKKNLRRKNISTSV